MLHLVVTQASMGCLYMLHPLVLIDQVLIEGSFNFNFVFALVTFGLRETEKI